jgi:pimeloyl-ACP methyl ester carboxylesterase
VRERSWIDNGHGWQLDAERHWEPTAHDRRLRPIVLVPGYCMNTFILGYHPRGRSLIQHFTEQGFEVWTANLRGQGDSRGGPRRFGFRELALTDVPAVLRYVLGHTASTATRADAIGCSLGGTILYAYLAHRRDDHSLGAMVAMGAPLRLVGLHPAIRAAFSSPRVASWVEVRGTRALARRALPIARRIPKLLNLYMNTSQIDLDAVDELVKTVDDPVAHLNAQIARWMRTGDLVVAGKNVTDAVRGLELPVLAVIGNADGIAPPESVRSAVDVIGRHRVDLLEVGDRDRWFAHADLFISRHAETDVFAPMSRWLRDKNTGERAA